MFTDFEQALMSALQKCYSGIPLRGDFFHFMQANIRWSKVNKYLQHMKIAIQMLRVLWNSSTLDLFQANYKTFKNYWNLNCASYANYFENY